MKSALSNEYRYSCLLLDSICVEYCVLISHFDVSLLVRCVSCRQLRVGSCFLTQSANLYFLIEKLKIFYIQDFEKYVLILVILLFF